jgi:hypothetical protein
MIILGLLLSCLGGLASWGETHFPDGGLAEIIAPHPSVSPALIRSSIDFQDPSHPVVHFANVQAPDQVSGCPADSAHINVKDLLVVVSGKVKVSVSRMQQNGGAHCAALEKRLNTVQSKVATALSEQIVTGTSHTQSEINRATQRASIVDELVVTISDLFQSQCLGTVDDRIVVQKLFGQLFSLGGIFARGVSTPLTTTGGQLVGSFPMFPSDADKALAVFRRYEEKEERGSFLCLYRQMQKTNCLLFTTPEETLIGGVDITGKSGPYFVTQGSIEKIKVDRPGIFADVVMLSQLNQDTEAFLSIMESPGALASGPIDGFLSLKDWCIRHVVQELQTTEYFPKALQENIKEIEGTCSALNQFRWGRLNSSGMGQLLFDTYWRLVSVKLFYESLLSMSPSERSEESGVPYVAETWESLKYFKGLEKTFEKVQNPSLGNQFRLNYYELVKKLGNNLAKKSLRFLMKKNHSASKKSVESRPRSLVSALDLCQTLDPTLACLYVDRPSKNRLQKEWKKWCVGPKSPLCRSVRDPKDKDKLLVDPLNRAYFDSLCGQ